MSLVIAFDDINVNGNNLIFEYLSNEFSSTLFSNGIAERIKDYRCLFTTSPKIAQELSSKLKTILYLNDPNEGYSSRGDNISNWRQNLSTFQNIENIFVASSALATTFLNTYRIPCKVQYPYVPKREASTSPSYILYNRPPTYLENMYDFAPGESYVMYNSEEDFKDAKIYIHVPEAGEQWHINILMAHTYGIPCITYKQGCFSEFCTTGDKVLPVGMDVKTWMNNFKQALRDHRINSKIVYDMSQRFHVMSNLQQHIKKALIDHGLQKTPPTFAEIHKKPSNLKKLQNRKAEIQSTFSQKMVRPPRNDYSGLAAFLNNNETIYAGVGGLGDALLTLAAAFKEPGSKIVFGANSSTKEVVKQLFTVFDIESLLVQNFNGSAEGIMTWNSIFDHPHCKSTVHIPKDLNYGDWGINTKHYVEKMITRIPLIKTIGKLVNPRYTKKVIGLCVRGSDHTSTWKQRYLSKDEYHRLIEKSLSQDATVIVFGSENDINYYNVYQNNNVIFMNSNFAISHPAPKYSISMRHMLTAINSCDLIISVDTWLKTYAGLAGIPCKVIMNRYFGKSTLEYTDPSDKIFLDPSIWGFEVLPIDSIF